MWIRPSGLFRLESVSRRKGWKLRVPVWAAYFWWSVWSGHRDRPKKRRQRAVGEIQRGHSWHGGRWYAEGSQLEMVQRRLGYAVGQRFAGVDRPNVWSPIVSRIRSPTSPLSCILAASDGLEATIVGRPGFGLFRLRSLVSCRSEHPPWCGRGRGRLGEVACRHSGS